MGASQETYERGKGSDKVAQRKSCSDEKWNWLVKEQDLELWIEKLLLWNYMIINFQNLKICKNSKIKESLRFPLKAIFFNLL